MDPYRSNSLWWRWYLGKVSWSKAEKILRFIHEKERGVRDGTVTPHYLRIYLTKTNTLARNEITSGAEKEVVWNNEEEVISRSFDWYVKVVSEKGKQVEGALQCWFMWCMSHSWEYFSTALNTAHKEGHTVERMFPVIGKEKRKEWRKEWECRSYLSSSTLKGKIYLDCTAPVMYCIFVRAEKMSFRNKCFMEIVGSCYVCKT